MAHTRIAFLLSTLCLVSCNGDDDGASSGNGANADTTVTDTTDANMATESNDVTEALNAVKTTTQILVEDDPTLDLSQSGAANAAAIAERAKSQTADCSGAQVEHTLGNTTVTMNFGSGCTTAMGVVVSGMVIAEVKLGRDPLISVEFALQDVGVHGKTVNGTAVVSSNDIASYTLNADLVVASFGSLTFTGTAVVGVESLALVSTLDGSGQFTLDKGKTVKPLGLTCTAKSADYELKDLHKVLTACWGNRGVMTATYPLTCGDRLSGTLVSESTWSSKTATTGVIVEKGSITISNGKSASLDPKDFQLPGSCK
jgi:hypothetical protein